MQLLFIPVVTIMYSSFTNLYSIDTSIYKLKMCMYVNCD